MKPSLLMPILSALVLTVSVPALAAEPAAPPECGMINPCQGKGGNGATVTDQGIKVTTPNKTIVIDKTETPPTVTFFDCDPDVEKDCDIGF
jgi:hypothetical protein